ncbi:MAG: Ig-like domain-containing protein, partial [Eubacterium sp.]|nr:Ig-like domain-containing protein [Eubacterium sp.]
VKKSVLSKAKKLKAGKKLKLSAKAIRASSAKVKIHRSIRYESTNTSIAEVSKKGIISARKKGTCYVYAYVQNGVSKTVKIVVK